MIIKYRHSKYQVFRTISVMFFQLTFAFLIPEILVRLNQPYFDFKNMWPLDYDFFDAWHIDMLTTSGGLGIFMFVWGITLFAIGVPVFVFFFGKRWYCSWVCGCGGLAETAGDPFRQLSDKSLKAWQIERYLVHGVLVFAVIMTAGVLYNFITGTDQIFGLSTYTYLRRPYGFMIGSIFSGVIGTGFIHSWETVSGVGLVARLPPISVCPTLQIKIQNHYEWWPMYLLWQLLYLLRNGH